MKKKTHNGRWMVAGAMLGAAGAWAGMSQMGKARPAMKKLRGRAACVASHAGHTAGSFISNMGDSVADMLR